MLRSSRLILLISLMAALGCSHSPHRSERGFLDSAVDDGNRAPASLQPPMDAGQIDQRIDSVSVRTRADYHYTMAEALSYEGQTQKAIEALKTVLIYDAEAPRVHLRLAAEYAKLGMLSESLESAQTAQRLQPKEIEPYLLLGGLYSTLKDYDSAIRNYEQVLVLQPENTEAPLYLGAVYAEKKDYPKSIRYFERLAQNDDYTTPHLAWYYIGRIRSEQDGDKNLQAAVRAYRQALAKKPDHVESVLALGQAYNRMKRTMEAVELYKNFQREQGPNEKIAEILAQVYLEQEDYGNALAQLEILEKRSEDTLAIKVRIALLLIELKKYPRAAEKLFEVLRQVPDSDKIRFYLAAVYEEMGRQAEAVEHFVKVPPLSSYYSESIIHAAYLLKNLKRTNEALKLIEVALKEKPETPQFYPIAANLFDEQGDLARAEEILAEGLKAFPENVQMNFYLGTLYDRKGRKDLVVEQMRRVINMDPHHSQGLNYLAFTFADQGKNLDEAEDLALRALEVEPQDGFVLDTYGWILFQQGQWGKAIPVLEKAHAAQPTESVIAEHLADAYFKAQLLEKARQMYMTALEKAEDKKRAQSIEQKMASLGIQIEVRADHRRPASLEMASPGSQTTKNQD